MGLMLMPTPRDFHLGLFLTGKGVWGGDRALRTCPWSWPGLRWALIIPVEPSSWAIASTQGWGGVVARRGRGDPQSQAGPASAYVLRDLAVPASWPERASGLFRGNSEQQDPVPAQWADAGLEAQPRAVTF